MDNPDGPASDHIEDLDTRVEIVAVRPSAARCGPMPDHIDFDFEICLPRRSRASPVRFTFRMTREEVLQDQNCSNADYLNWTLLRVGAYLSDLAEQFGCLNMMHKADDYSPTLGVRTVFDWEEIGLRWLEAPAGQTGAGRPGHLR